jgi:hypothetical protein
MTYKRPAKWVLYKKKNNETYFRRMFAKAPPNSKIKFHKGKVPAGSKIEFVMINTKEQAKKLAPKSSSRKSVPKLEMKGGQIGTIIKTLAIPVLSELLGRKFTPDSERYLHGQGLGLSKRLREKLKKAKSKLKSVLLKHIKKRKSAIKDVAKKHLEDIHSKFSQMIDRATVEGGLLQLPFIGGNFLD